MLSCCSQPRPNLPVFCHALPLTWSFPSSLAEVLVPRIRREVWRWMFLCFWLKYLYLKCLDRVFLYDMDSTGVPFWAFVNTCKSFNCPLHSDSYLVCAREGMSAPIMASITSNRIFFCITCKSHRALLQKNYFYRFWRIFSGSLILFSGVVCRHLALEIQDSLVKLLKAWQQGDEGSN